MPEDDIGVPKIETIALGRNVAYSTHHMATTLENGLYSVAVSDNPTSGTDDYYVNDDYNYSVDKLQHDYV